MRVWDVLTFVGAAICALFVLAALAGGMSAVQQGATAAMGLAIAAIPYFISATMHRSRAELERTRAAEAAEAFTPAPPQEIPE